MWWAQSASVLAVQLFARNDPSASRQGRPDASDVRRELYKIYLMTDPLNMVVLPSNNCRLASVKQLASLQHLVHDNGELAGDSNSGTLVANSFPQFQPPIAQHTFCGRAREQDGRCFVEQATQTSVTTPRDVTIMVDFSGLVALGGQPNPSTD